MKNVIQILYQIIGPIIFILALATLYLISDNLNSTLSYLKSRYTDDSTYVQGQYSTLTDMSSVSGMDVKSFISNGAEPGCIYSVVDSSTGTKTKITYSNTGYVLLGEYSDIFELYKHINSNDVYVMSVIPSSEFGKTNVTFTLSRR